MDVERSEKGQNDPWGWKNEREAWCKRVAGSVRRGTERKEGGLSDGANGGTRNARWAREQRMVGGYNWWLEGRGGGREEVWYGLWTASHGSVCFRSASREVCVCFLLKWLFCTLICVQKRNSFLSLVIFYLEVRITESSTHDVHTSLQDVLISVCMKCLIFYEVLSAFEINFSRVIVDRKSCRREATTACLRLCYSHLDAFKVNNK